ncbi:ATP5A1 isoform 17 [Pan troglodytes]|uniref:ATP synthase F1 subunit alpha n=2 Tax=Homininae TaxID=207598 RepID=K7EKV9_HUMAN|nr:ATP5A1 isoform 17 [Pan troglodytes]
MLSVRVAAAVVRALPRRAGLNTFALGLQKCFGFIFHCCKELPCL